MIQIQGEIYMKHHIGTLKLCFFKPNRAFLIFQSQQSQLNQIQTFSLPSFIILIFSMIKILATHTHFPSLSDHHNKENIPHQTSPSFPKVEVPINPEDSKEKSELCRSYMQFGFCPYEMRCKFAHGSHQLLKNNQLNNKYKTKECQNFKKHGCCMYGKRCNFIHVHLHSEASLKQVREDILMRLVRMQRRRQSALQGLFTSK